MPELVNINHQSFDPFILDEKEITKELARKESLEFIKYTWYKQEPFVIGQHTRTICDRIDRAIRRLRKGKSTYIAISVPPRHGKSQIVSRHLPAFFKGLFPEKEVLTTGYSADLMNLFSKDCRDKIVKQDAFMELFPGVRLARNSKSVMSWNLENLSGEELNGGLNYAGLLGGLTGKGYHLGICDDPVKGREEAESATMRDKTWTEFTNSFLTRRAPVSITIVLLTRWNIDDIVGRIKAKTDPKSDDYDPDFPVFEIINFPARDENGEWLFLERFPESYYKQIFAILSRYESASLMQGQPTPRGGNLLNIEGVKIHDDIKDFPNDIVYHRVWDLAHSKKEKIKNDPDWTSGTLFGVREEKNDQGVKVPHLWVKHVGRIRDTAPKRDKFILSITDQDGDTVRVAIESTTDAKDTYETFVSILEGKRTVVNVASPKDKVIRAEPLEAVFEAGNVHILRAPWNRAWLDEVSAFPNGKHDDQVDNLSSGYALMKRGNLVTGSFSSGVNYNESRSYSI